jgi:hypothetical protein
MPEGRGPRGGWGFAAIAALLLMALAVAAPAQPRSTGDALRLAGNGTEVDVELVLAVDVSFSMDPEEQVLQRRGYVEAIRSREFADAVRKGMIGKVAVTYVEWGGASEQRVIVPWRLVDGAAAAAALADEIERQPIRRVYRTSISAALLFSAALFEGNGFEGLRKVIDVSGDGPNNQGPLIVPTRDEVLARGIVINGLPIMIKRPNTGLMDIAQLDIYYEDCVIGGPGAFVVGVDAPEKFAEAIRTKIVQEIAAPVAKVLPAQLERPSPRVSCTIGERLWQERWGHER